VQLTDLGVHEHGWPDDAAADALRRDIRAMIRRSRREKRLTQAELGRQVNTSRFTINRIETGSLDLSSHLVEPLAEILDLPDLATLVAQRDNLLVATVNERDLVLRRLLNTPSVKKVVIASVDDLNIYEMLLPSRSDMPILSALDIDIIFPSAARERQLFNGRRPLYGHVEYQIKRLSDLQGSDDYSAANLRIHESDSILSSCAIVSTRAGTECAFWPLIPTPGKTSDATLPVITSVDPNTTGRFEAYAAELIRSSDPIHTNEALCQRASAESGPQFTRFFSVGSDQEDDVDENEGFAVSLILVVALCTRKHYGIKRRLITYKRPSSLQDRERLSLFSNNVNDVDIRAARALAEKQTPEERRSTSGALASAIDISGYLAANSGVIPDLAYRLAAIREFATFNLSVAPDRLSSVTLPDNLNLIHKPSFEGHNRAAVAPKLFVLELDATRDQPELDVLRANADIEEVGLEDMRNASSLNDFLIASRDRGFLLPLLTDLRIAEQ
jgi:DNA-binding XRE family transcriptional regulator